MKRWIILAMLVAGTAWGQESLLRPATVDEMMDGRIQSGRRYALCLGGTNYMDEYMVLKEDNNWYRGAWVRTNTTGLVTGPATPPKALMESLWGIEWQSRITNAIDMNMLSATNTSMARFSPEAHIQNMQRDGTLTNVIQKLAKSGDICTVFGHVWRDGRPGEGETPPGSGTFTMYADWYPNTKFRTCGICGVCQSASINDWK